MIILLDSGPLGLLTNPNKTPDAEACRAWQRRLVLAGDLPLIPAIIDYELRRELRLMKRLRALAALDGLKAQGNYLPLTENALLQAADFWAMARQTGMPTADRLALDADVILAGQAATLDPADWGRAGDSVVIATGNVGHLSRFVAADLWTNL